MSNFQSIVCDLDGVLYLAAEPVPGAGEALRALADAGIDLWFVTNNSTRTADDTAAKISLRTGYPASAGQVVTSAMSTAAHLRGHVGSAMVLGGDGLVRALTAAGISVLDASDAPEGDPAEVDAVVIGLDLHLSYRRLAAATAAVRAGARLVASNIDATFPTPKGLAPGAGSMVAAVERATDRTAEPCGKPHEPMLRFLADRMAPGPVLVVGDRLDTDLSLGWAAGWATALVLTGVTTDDESQDPRIDMVLASIAELPAALGL